MREVKLNVKSCERNHLEVFRRHLLNDAESPLKKQTVNKYMRSISQILIAAENNGLLKRRAKLERLPTDVLDPSEKLYLRDEQIDALMGAADKLTWPKFESSGLQPSTWWRCALVLYRIYGFRPQELLAYGSTKKPITWKNISFDEVSPNPSTHEINKYGWLYYTPPKTQKSKPTPLYLPLTRHARAALDLVLVSKVASDAPVFRMPFSQQSFLKEWYSWLEFAGVKPKIEDARFKPKCLRNTCATYLSSYKNGLATAVCGWGPDRESSIANGHYISANPLLQELHAAPMPKSFDELFTN